MADYIIRITPEAKEAYDKAFHGWGTKERASEALIIGIEVQTEMDKYKKLYQEECKKKAQKEALNSLIKKYDKEKQHND